MTVSFRPDTWPIEKQRRLAFLPKVVPFWLADRWMRARTRGESARESYLARMVFEVMWLGAGHLRRYFDHSGVEHIDPNETYVLTSLHFGHWAMYSASLNQQFGIANQMVATGRNIDLEHPMGHYWYHFGHTRQDLSGHPACYSTDSIFAHLRRLRQGTSLVVVADVREGDFYQKEVSVRFLGERLYLQRTPALLARRAGVRILPYIGWFDEQASRHKVQWFEPITCSADDAQTLQRVADRWEPTFAAHRHQYFNVWSAHTQPLVRTTRATA